MKISRLSKKVTALLLCAAFLSSGLTAAAAGIGSTVYSSSIELAGSVTYKEITANSAQSGREQAYMLEYQPGNGVSPVVAYGNKLYGRSDISAVASFVEKQGGTFLAGVNADYFTLATGVPDGLTVTDGILRSSDAWQNAVGFLPDGSAVIGAPHLNMSLKADNGLDISVTYINKVRTVYGVYLLNEDFSASTHISTPGTNVLLKRLDSTPVTIGGTVRMRVESIGKTSQSTSIPAGYMVLTVDDKGPENRISELTVGQELTLSVTPEDERWNRVTYAAGAGDTLLADGAVASGLSDKIMPCTAVGVKSDGTVVFYAVDGRQSGFSAGMTLPDLAAELRSLGCVTAVNMDGGGSTTIAVRYPGQDGVEVTNSPSDGKPRECATFIFLTNTAPRTGTAAKLYIYPYDALVLAGASLTLETKAVDGGYYAAAVPDMPAYTLTNPIGTMQDNVFTAGPSTGTTDVQVTAGGLSGTAVLSVYSYMDELKVKKTDGKSYVSSLSLNPGDVVSLDAVPILNNRSMYSQDSLFTWTTEGDVGSIDAEGNFTASPLKGLEGAVVVSYGASSVRIPVTVGQAPSVADSFDAPTNWSATASGEGCTASAAADGDYNHVRYGTGSLSVRYSFPEPKDGAENPAVTLTSAPTVKLKNNPGYVNLWVYGDGSGTLLSVIAADASGAQLAATQQQPIDFTGWKLLSFALPSGASAIRSLLLEKGSGTVAAGQLWFDQLTQSYAGPLSDTAAPQIAIDGASAELLTASVRDESGAAVRKADITVLIDGKPLDFQYNPSSFALTASPAVTTPGLHKITVTARDGAGNTARLSSSYSVETDGQPVFSDADGHWAQSYLEYLNARGVMTGEQKQDTLVCRPESETTRTEMAVLVCRYLGLDTEKSASAGLPFADAAEIPSWALSYVKAMYANGLMKGDLSGGKLYFRPNASVTRMEAMAILGRTLPQGYAASALTASDKGSVESWALPHIEKLTALGVVSGYPDNTIRPNNRIVRAEIAAILYRMY